MAAYKLRGIYQAQNEVVGKPAAAASKLNMRGVGVSDFRWLMGKQNVFSRVLLISGMPETHALWRDWREK